MKVNRGGIKEGTMVEVLEGKTPVLIANVGGSYYAVGGICPHMRCHLQKGTLKGSTVTCPCHGASFDVTTGRMLSWVASMSKDLAMVSKYLGWAKDLKTYSVKADGDYLELS
ncbi:Rieske (2Fe-2S) protein [Candidatus Magnetominusculus xianensis]|uniref:(2Fe-2S)-binding protein n=1 Tax=Candidatus Magnetominusculus xianensis TaxID=1748249 RepID=A0ABR5SII2_9BACT|nr:Rieske (2Fe-2S) protein [Candidatus Magnetominusculus xianensis]KWT92702.1 (2Fe-2S)-binding protein [Candidatus Magnetominusculus xianensis]MBF0403747.1 Rieske (2Fe-2S) protein [Nitrospirota bacterium]